MKVDTFSVEGLQALRLTEHDIQVVVMPGLGAKLWSLSWQGHELLAQNPIRPLRLARYGAPYSEFDASGFDECLPTIGPCLYPEYPWQNAEAPDHGEVWSIPWAWRMDQAELHLHCRGVRFAYDFYKSLAMPAPGRLRLSYALVNQAPVPFKFLWSSHPLLALESGMRIHLPPDTRVRVDWSKDERLGEMLHEHSWPHTTDKQGQPVDLSLILPPEVGLVDKLYTIRLRQGWCALHDPNTGRYTAFLFSPESIPYVGLSINLGGWPVEGPGYYNLGLEPCNGFPDRLDLAIERGQCAVAAPGQRMEWQMDLCAGLTTDLPAEIERLRSERQPDSVTRQTGATLTA